MGNINIKTLTLDQYRKVLNIKVIPDIEKVMHVPTYYRIRNGTNKYSPQDRSLDKLRKLFKIDAETLGILIENQLKLDKNN